MAKKNGIEAFDEICRLRPDIKVLFKSGYTADIIHPKGVLDSHLDFVSKTLFQEVLLNKIRQVLSKDSNLRALPPSKIERIDRAGAAIPAFQALQKQIKDDKLRK